MVRWLNLPISVRFGLNLLGSALITFALAGLASAETGLEVTTNSTEELTNQGGDTLIEKYEDIAREYGGFRRSPLLFGSNKSGGSHHPGLSVPGIDVGMNPHNTERAGIFYNGSFGSYSPLGSNALDLSVDEEIYKSSRVEFQPIVAGASQQTIQQSFLSNEHQRDAYLDTFQTARTIAIMTLGYLDKTVAAGLATSQSQADSDAVQQLLKQMNQSISKMSNPELARLYEDNDEKFQFCMRDVRPNTAGVSAQVTGVQPGQPKPEAITFDYVVACNLVDGSKFCGGPQAYANSRYHFCSCCAESSSSIGRSTIQQVGGLPGVIVGGEGYSLVDRIFMGATVPTGKIRLEQVKAATPGSSTAATSTTTTTARVEVDAGRALVDFAAMARSLYGDILFAPKNNISSYNGASSGSSNRSGDRLTIKLASPLLSIQQWIKMVRDYSEVKNLQPFETIVRNNSAPPGSIDRRSNVTRADVDKSCHWQLNEGMWIRYCPTFGGSLVWGICPALKTLIQLERDNKLDSKTDNVSVPGVGARKISDSVDQLWTEASLGGALLSRADLATMAEMSGTSEGDRIIESFCDTSAVEAMRRLHRKTTTLANDMMAANRKATDREKKDMQSLIARVDDQLKLGAEDSRSKVDEILLALDMQRDRARDSYRSSLVATGNASERQARRVGMLFRTFGGPYPN
jgi:hypothetical protein